jgi:phenylpropionate dioxygenase-like ring-hydroxylating dioxygenase large terminal subunit
MTLTADAADRARSPGLSYQDLLDADSRPVPDVLRWQSSASFGQDDKPVDRYISREIHELEKERLWTKVWQMACRESELADVGDTQVYDITDISILLVRTSPTEIKAFYNACLHRGRQLREHPGPVTELRCPFHGYAWNLDGSLKHVPCQWDFPQVVPEEFRLPEVKVGTWGGFVFINMDPNAEQLDSFLGDLPKHFERWPLEKRFKQAHVARVLPTNWKTVQEAFMEAYHVVATHPQLLPGIGDTNSQYDAWGNFSRAITPNGTPSPHLKWTPTEQDMFDSMSDRRLDMDPYVVIPDGMTARQVAGRNGRAMMAPFLGAGADELTDAELTDSFYYTLFPNFHPWGAYNRIVYRFRPYQDEHEMAVMECMFLSPYDEAEGRPGDAPVHWLGVDDDWTEAPELGLLARVFNQDCFNLPKVQKGLHTLRRHKPGVTMAVYQETKVRHFHALFEQWLGV